MDPLAAALTAATVAAVYGASWAASRIRSALRTRRTCAGTGWTTRAYRPGQYLGDTPCQSCAGTGQKQPAKEVA